MLNRKALRFVCATCLCAGLCTFVGAGTSTLPPHLAATYALVEGIAPTNNAYLVYEDYPPADTYIGWPGVDGFVDYENSTDCSSFFDLLVEHVYGVTPAQLKSWTGSVMPLAQTLHDTIASGKLKKIITQITTIQQIKPGDVAAISYADNPDSTDDTGHVFIVAEKPVQMTASAPIEPNTTQWSVTILDCTTDPHGPDDTRYEAMPDGSNEQGVGMGTFRFYVNPNGTIAGYSWSTLSVSTFYPQTGTGSRNLVIGRIIASN